VTNNQPAGSSNTNRHQETVLPYFAITVAAAVWGGSFVFMKDSLEKQNVFSFLAIRFAIAALLMLMYRPKALLGLNQKFIVRGAIAGSILALGYILQSIGLTKTTVSNTGFITGLYLVFTPLISAIAIRKPIKRWHLVAVIFATTGLFLISFNGWRLGYGETLVLISAAVYGAHIVVLGEWSDGSNTYALALIQIMTTAIICSICAVFVGFEWVPDGSVWISILFTAFLATFFAFLVQTWSQSFMHATAAAVLFATETPFAVLFGLIFQNDPMTIRIAIGGLLIMTAMFLVIWSDNRRSAKLSQ
jgi:drug/metabolite transporter (DMT)-like permease